LTFFFYIRSPVTLFTASSKKRPAELKIKMLRLFEDCIDMSEPNSDGWTIIGDLVGSFNQESAPANSNSIFWFLRSLKWDSMVGFGPKTLWHGLQHAVRSFVDLERQQMVVKNRLDLMVGREFPSSYATAIMYWIVLRAVGNKLLPLLLAAGSFMHLEGYDYDQGSEVDPTVLAKHLPYLYDEWCRVFTTSLESTDEVLNLELDAVLEQAGWTEDTLQNARTGEVMGNFGVVSAVTITASWEWVLFSLGGLDLRNARALATSKIVSVKNSFNPGKVWALVTNHPIITEKRHRKIQTLMKTLSTTQSRNRALNIWQVTSASMLG
jgi:hypothetical protein